MKNKNAFTLIELLVVVIVIGILVSVALPKYRAALEKTYAAEALTFIGTLAQSEHRYFALNSEYNDDLTDLDININHMTCGKACYSNYYYYSLDDPDKIIAARIDSKPNSGLTSAEYGLAMIFGSSYLHDSYKYAFSRDLRNGEITCYWKNLNGKKICKLLNIDNAEYTGGGFGTG